MAPSGQRDLMRPSQKLLPFAILGAAMLVVLLLLLVRRTPEDRVREYAAPLVRVVVAEPVAYQFSVTAHGSVSPRTESDLIPQVSGEVLWTSPSLAAGGFFESGQVLARIDSADYRVDRETARAEVARATSMHARAEKELKRQQTLANRSVASESRIDDAENAFRVAEASLQEALARLERAARDFTRTELKAPYRGRVRSKQVGVGQFVSRGAPIAKLYAVDYAEVRLPVPDRELAYLNVPLVRKTQRESDSDATPGSRVLLTAEFAGRHHQWEGNLVRTEAELDARSRMVNLVARVSDPYGLGDRLEAGEDSPETVPLSVGLFVEATIEGQSIDRAFVIPRDALREGNRVYLVDPNGELQIRDVEVLRTQRENVIVAGGLSKGDRICISPLEAAINGMQVRVVEGDSDSGTGGNAADGDATDLDERNGLAEHSAAAEAAIQ
jgi:RND family efflux transporter MFP subunit